METNYCDMHIHTTCSDGTLTPSEILTLAKLRGLKKICITDHDTVDAYSELRKIQETPFEGEIIAGCEFVCCMNGVAIEILGYGIDWKKAKRYLSKHGVTESSICKTRVEYLHMLIEKYGITIGNYDDLIKKCGQSHDMALFFAMQRDKKFVNLVKSENASLLKTFSNFIRYGIYNPESMFYKDMSIYYPKAEFIIKKIHEFGGMAFIAHPFLYGDSMLSIIDGLAEKLDGVECYHWSTQEPEKRQVLLNCCKKHKLMISGGSDYHGKLEKETQRLELGYAYVPDKYFDKVKAVMPKHDNQYFTINKQKKQSKVG